MSPPDLAAVLAVSPFAAVTALPTRGVRLTERRPPVHSVLLGPSVVDLDGRLVRSTALAVPARRRHRVIGYHGPHGGVAYLDARWFRYEDAAALALRWSGFVPGRDDVRELLGDALRVPRRPVDERLLRALEALESGVTVASAANAAGLSEGRFTHLMTEALGAPPREWRAWLRLRRAIGHATLDGHSLTRAAHDAGFADAAHLTRTTRRMLGVAPSQGMPRAVHAVAV